MDMMHSDEWLHLPEALLQQYLQAAHRLDLNQYVIAYHLDFSLLAHTWREHNVIVPPYLSHATDARLDEFFAGRILAQAILQQHYHIADSITSLHSKLPIWSQSIIGSISHAKQQLVVAVAKDTAYLGVDLEFMVEPDIAQQTAELILTASEIQRWYSCEMSHMSFEEYFTLMFSVKESLYKAVYPIAKSYIDFLEVSLVEIDFATQSLTLAFLPSIIQKFHLLDQYHAYWQIDHLQINPMITWVFKPC